MQLQLRRADRSDLAAVRLVGARAGSHDLDLAYFEFVADEGCLMVAIDGVAGDDRDDGDDGSGLVGYAARVDVGSTMMISDLFVDPDARGRGVGAALAAAVTEGASAVQTCSSQHPAAVHLYGALGLEPRGRLLYLVGDCTGGGRALVDSPWRHERSSLVRHFESTGARVCGDVVVREDDDAVSVLRLEHPDPRLIIERVSAAFPRGRLLRSCVPDWSPLAEWMMRHGFVVEDHDVVMAHPAVEFDSSVGCVHAGLW